MCLAALCLRDRLWSPSALYHGVQGGPLGTDLHLQGKHWVRNWESYRGRKHKAGAEVGGGGGEVAGSDWRVAQGGLPQRDSRAVSFPTFPCHPY